MRKIVPAGHRLIVKLKKSEQMTKGGLKLYADSDNERHTLGMQEAYVESIGYQAFKDFGDGTDWCEIGDLIYMKKYAGEDVIDEDSGEYLRVINDEDVLAIIKDK